MNNFFKIYKILSKDLRIKFYLMIIFINIMSILELAGLSLIPVFLLHFFDNGDPVLNFMLFETLGRNIQFSFLLICIFLILIYVLKNIILIFLIKYEGDFFKKIVISFSDRLFNYYLNQNITFHGKHNLSFFIRNLTLEVPKSADFIKNHLVLIREGIMFLFIFTFLILINPLITTLLFLTMGSLILMFYFYFKKNLSFRSKNTQMLRASIIKSINEAFSSIRVIKIFNLKEKLNKFYLKDLTNVEENDKISQILSRIPKYFIEVIIVTIVLGLILILDYLDYEKSFIISYVAILVIAGARLSPAANSIISALSIITYHHKSFSIVNNELKDLNTSDQTNNTYIENFPENFNKLEFKNVNYEHKDKDNEKSFKLENINFCINKGEKVLLIGKSGSGKSTILNLIMGLVKPVSGDVLYTNDRKKSSKNESTTINELFSLVSQDNYVFDSSIKNNISLFSNDINQKKYSNVIKWSKVDQIIENKDDTPIGQQGELISGGERQRLAIARAIYKNFELLIMDEPFSSLDEINKKNICESIFSNFSDKTMILASHDLQNFSYYDKIIILKLGKISKILDKNIINKEGMRLKEYL